MSLQFWVGWLYCFVGLISGIAIFAGLSTHEESCDNCILGKDISHKWKTTSFSAKFVMMTSFGGMLLWPVALVYCITMVIPSLIYERFKLRPASLVPRDILRAWYKCHPKKKWHFYSYESEVESMKYVEFYLTGDDGKRMATVICKGNDTSVHMHRGEKHRIVNIGDPEVFDKIDRFMDSVFKK